jgi:hypothetical protein
MSLIEHPVRWNSNNRCGVSRNCLYKSEFYVASRDVAVKIQQNYEVNIVCSFHVNYILINYVCSYSKYIFAVRVSYTISPFWVNCFDTTETKYRIHVIKIVTKTEYYISCSDTIL